LDKAKERDVLDSLRDLVALRLERGAGVADVESELIDAAPGLDEDERAALWLFAWAYRPGGRGAGRTGLGRVAK
jgi:hypothetical protein